MKTVSQTMERFFSCGKRKGVNHVRIIRNCVRLLDILIRTFGVIIPDHLTSFAMGNLLTIIAVILIIAWLIGFVGYSASGGGLIHILLIIAAIAVLLRIIHGRKII